MLYHSNRVGSVVSCSATTLVDATPKTIVEAHVLERNASKFRDVQKYSKFSVGADGIIDVEFPAKIAFFPFTQKFCKRATANRIDFWTPADSLAQIRGKWSFKRFHGKTLVEFEQIAKVPGWATIFPLESYIRSRVTRMMQDTAALPASPAVLAEDANRIKTEPL
jgi:hypothetical protein